MHIATASVSWLITCLRRNPGRPSNHRDASSCWQSACATNYTFHSYYDVHPYHHHHHHQRRLHSYHQQAHLTNWTLCHAVSLPQPTYLNTVQFSYEKNKTRIYNRKVQHTLFKQGIHRHQTPARYRNAASGNML